MSQPAVVFEPISSAQFSECRKFRHLLFRQWAADGPLAGFIGKNPSVANESDNDPTITREIAFAKSWGCRGLVKVNLYDFIATDANDLAKAGLWSSAENMLDKIVATLKDLQCKPVVCCWGTHSDRRLKANIQERGDSLRRRLKAAGLEPMCFKVNSDGTPQHPLYLSAKTELRPF